MCFVSMQHSSETRSVACGEDESDITSFRLQHQTAAPQHINNTADAGKNIKSRKEPKKNKKKKKKKERQAAEGADNLMSELPFTNTEVWTELGFTSTESSVKKKRKRGESGRVESEEDGDKKKKKKETTRPNYFLSVPITNPKIKQAVQDIQKQVLERDSRLSRALIPVNTLHITLLVTHLSTQEQVHIAASALSDLELYLNTLMEGRSLLLPFCGVGHFKQEVAFVRIAEGEHLSTLTRMAERVRKLFEERGITSADDKAFKPHLTFLKLSRASKLRKQGVRKLDPALFSDFESVDFGAECVCRVDLCSMLKKKTADGYYHCEKSVTFTSGEELPEPQNVHFYSFNLRNMVRWTPGERAVNETGYTVEYAVYGDAEESKGEWVRWRPVERCTFIQHTECDVSQETFNLQEEYYTRVKAVSPHTQSQWTESGTRFRPMTDTILGPPLVKLNMVQNYINITMKGPFRWKTKKTKKEKSLWKMFPHMIYNVSVYNSKSKHTQSFSLQTSTLTLGPLDFSTQVCVVVQAQSQSLPLASEPGERWCAETPKDVFKDRLLVAMLGGVLPSALCLCVLAVVGGLFHCYITDHKQTLPKSTDLVHVSEKHQTLQPGGPQTIIVNLISIGEESKPISPVLQLQAVSEQPSSVGGAQSALESLSCYAWQHVPEPGGSAAGPADSQAGWSETDGSEPREPRCDEAGDYGIVLPAKVEAEAPCGTDISPYRSQVNTIEPRPLEDEDHEEEMQVFLDWNPDTCELKIPLMGLIENGEQTDNEADEVTLLPKVILRQCSEESSEQEDDFTKMERNWGLIIQ